MKDSIINQPHQYVYACTMQTFICIGGRGRTLKPKKQQQRMW